jgi:two-component system NtrC family response regulator
VKEEIQSEVQLFSADPSFLVLREEVSRLAQYPISILLQGESGTGKELFARSVHEKSPQNKGPFIAINCAAIPEGLLESELFGHEKGSFTGASNQVRGKIECAQKGTLFLDEIGDLPLSLQPKLLRFLEDRLIERVGGRAQIQVEVRIVAATHQSLEQLISSGRFRSDLYYRLAEAVIKIPALRQRFGDVLILAWIFLRKYSQEFKINLRPFSHEALAALEQYSWPGNVRELQNRVKSAVLLAKGHFIEPSDLKLDFEQVHFAALQLRLVRDLAEREAIVRALAYMDHNISRAAELLDISRPKLYHLIAKYQLKLEELA